MTSALAVRDAMCGEHTGALAVPVPCVLPWPDIRLWLVDLDRPEAEEAQAWLSVTEIERAGRFVFPRDARRYRTAHTALRQLLASHAGLPPHAEFTIGPHGKPRLGHVSGVGFNLSHSHGIALIGIGDADDFGVDVECVRAMSDINALAERNFTAAENDELRRASPDDALHAFLRGWTRKEACLKALGTGLSIEPGCFEAGLAARARSLTISKDGEDVGVSVQSVSPGAGMLAAVARLTPVHPH